MNSFKKNKYKIVRKALPRTVATYLFHYLLLKRQVYLHLSKTNFIAPDNVMFGSWGDSQVPNSYNHYADAAMETLLIDLLPLMTQHTEVELIPTYSFLRIYKRGDGLARHIDRPSCDISATIFLGGYPWDIFIQPPSSPNPKRIKLGQGDMLIYRGCEIEHWREPFQDQECAQVFLHYNKSNNVGNKWDGRPMLGLPHTFKINK